MNRDLLLRDLIRDEGIKLLVYDDATGAVIKPGTLVKGHPSIGIGRALDVHGISKPEALYLGGNDITEVEFECSTLSCWKNLDDVRQRVLANMCFNLGLNGLKEFQKMLSCVSQGAWEAAASEMESSAWYRETGVRASRLASMMRSGQDPL